MTCGDGKVRLCINVPAEVYQRLYERSVTEKRPMCEIMMESFLLLENIRDLPIGGPAWVAMWSKPFDHPEMT